jgi:hypothetical protein
VPATEPPASRAAAVADDLRRRAVRPERIERALRPWDARETNTLLPADRQRPMRRRQNCSASAGRRVDSGDSCSMPE